MHELIVVLAAAAPFGIRPDTRLRSPDLNHCIENLFERRQVTGLHLPFLRLISLWVWRRVVSIAIDGSADKLSCGGPILPYEAREHVPAGPHGDENR